MSTKKQLEPSEISEVLIANGFKKYVMGDRRTRGFSVKRIYSRSGMTAVQLIYNAGKCPAKEKRDRKMKHMDQYMKILLEHGYRLSTYFPSSAKATYVIGKTRCLDDRCRSFDSMQINSILTADTLDPKNIADLYLISSIWTVKGSKVFSIRSMKYGIQLSDEYTPMTAATCGYRVIGSVPDEVVRTLEKFWSNSNRPNECTRISEVIPPNQHKYFPDICFLPKANRKKSYKEWRNK